LPLRASISSSIHRLSCDQKRKRADTVAGHVPRGAASPGRGLGGLLRCPTGTLLVSGPGIGVMAARPEQAVLTGLRAAGPARPIDFSAARTASHHRLRPWTGCPSTADKVPMSHRRGIPDLRCRRSEATISRSPGYGRSRRGSMGPTGNFSPPKVCDRR
jgi:hypothetical protein